MSTLRPEAETVAGAAGQPPPGRRGLLPENLARAVFRNTLALMLGNACITGMKYAAYVLVFRTLGAERFGEYSLVLTLVAYGEVVLDFGLGEIFVRDLSREPARRQELTGIMAALKALQVLVAYGALAVLLFSLGYPRQLVAAGLIAGLEFLFFAGVLVYRSLFKAAMVIERAVMAELAGTLLFLAGTALACFRGLPLTVIFAGLAAGRLVFFLLCMRSGGDVAGRISFRWDNKAMKGYFLDTLPLGLTAIMVGIYTSADQLMLSKLDGWKAVGLYSAAYRFVLPLIAVPAAFMSALYPVLCAWWQTRMEDFRRVFQLGVDTSILMGGALFCGVTGSAEFLMQLFGHDAVEAADGLRMLAWGIAAMSLSTVFGPMFLVVRRFWLACLFGVCGATVNLLLNYVLIPHYSYMGSAFATFATEMTVLVPATLLMQRLTGCRLRWRVLPRVILSAAAAMLAVRQAGIMGTFGGGLAALAIFAGGCLLTGAADVAEIRKLLAKVRTKA